MCSWPKTINPSWPKTLLICLPIPALIVGAGSKRRRGRKATGDSNIDSSPLARIEIAWFAKQWQGIEQVFRLERTTTICKTGEVRHEVVYGLSSLALCQAPPQRLLALIRARLAH